MGGASPESNWWHGNFGDGQPWGPTDYTAESAAHGYTHWHAGQDWQLPMRTPIYAPVDCNLVFYGEHGYGDSAPELDISGGVHIILGHLDELENKTIGHIFRAGDLIGYSGTKGFSSGPHLHFEARVAPFHYANVDVDPTPYLLIQGAPPEEDDDLKPEVLDYAAGGLEPFWVRDGNLWHAFFDAKTGWTSQALSTDGQLVGQPAAKTWKDGHPEVFVFHKDGSLYHTWRDASNMWVPVDKV